MRDEYGKSWAELPALVSKINQVCGQFAARPLADNFHGEIDASYAGDLKVSTVTACGINLYRTRQEIQRDNDARFYTVFQLAGGRRSSRMAAGRCWKAAISP